MTKLTDDNEFMGTRINDLAEQVTNLESRLNVVYSKLATTEEENTKLNKKYEKKTESLKKVKQQMAAIESEYQNLKEASEREINRLADQVDKQVKRSSTLAKEKLDFAEKYKSECIVRLDQQTQATEERMMLIEKVQELQLEVDQSRKTCTMQQLQLDRMRLDHKNLLEQTTNLYEQQLEEKGEKIDDLNEQIEKLNAKLELERELLMKTESELKKVTKRYDSEVDKNKQKTTELANTMKQL